MKPWRGLPFLLLMLAPQPVFAHGIIGTGLIAGLSHPVGGWDHLLAMVAVGIISTKIGGWHVWGIPLLFLLGMSAGYGLGLQQAALPYTEWAILLSVVGLGLLLAWPQRPLLPVVMLLVLLFGLSHGYAHGLEWPQQASVGWFSLGFLASTTGLHLIGVILGLLFKQAEQPPRSFALAGCGISATGVILMLLYTTRGG